jgi:Domain of unknown function (DUF3303)
MRMMMKVRIDTAAGSDAIQSGRLGQVMQQTMESIRPEAAYFGPDGGHRTAFIVFDMQDPSQLPQLTEPLYSTFQACVEFFPVMNQDDLQRGLAQVGA